MKRIVVRGLCISFFLIIFLVSVLCVRPIYKALSKTISQKIESLCISLQDNTGITFSYSSMSPSILTVFNVKGIVLSSFENGKDVVSIRRIVFKYSLINLLSGDIDSALKSLTIDGVTIQYDDAVDRKLIEKLINFVQIPKQSAPSSASGVSSFNVTDIPINLPFDVIIKNVRIIYSDNAADATVTIRMMSAEYDDGALNIRADSTTDVFIKNGNGIAVQGKCSFNGVLREGLNGSSLIARFSHISAADFSFGQLNFLVSYEDGMLSARTIQLSFPLMVRASYNIKTGMANASLIAQRFSPVSFITSRKYANSLRKFTGTTLTLDASISCNVAEKEIIYDGSTQVYMPSGVVPGTLTVRFNFSGNEKTVSVPHLILSGEQCAVDGSLAYEFAGYHLSGNVNASRIAIPNGGIISTELYFDPLNTGFVCFAPQVFFDEKALTAMQLSILPQHDSIDYSFEISDYAHPDAEEAGLIQIDGSYLTKTNYIQAGVSVTNEFLDSVAELAAFFLPDRDATLIETFLSGLQPYMFTGEVYISSDFQSISYNAPYALVANTQRENQALFVSFDGNEATFQLTQLDIVYNSQIFQASAEFNRSPDSTSSFFVFDVNYGSVPYHFIGNIMPNFVSISGDYGITAQMQRFTDGSLEGMLTMNNFPVNIAGTIFTLSTETGIAYAKEDGIAVHIARFEADGVGGSMNFSPHVVLSGTVTKYGAVFDSISYSDMFSSLAGSADVIVNLNERIFNSARFTVLLQNQLSEEFIKFSADITNPDGLAFSSSMVKNSMYFDAQLELNSLDLNRFASEQSINNALNAFITATGTFENPYVVLSIDSANMMFAGTRFSLGGNATIEERNIRIDEMNITYGSLYVDSITADMSLATFTGKAAATLNVTTTNKSLHLPLLLEVSDAAVDERIKLPSTFAVTLSSPGPSGNLITKPFPFSFTVVRNELGMVVSSSDNLGIAGSISNAGDINIAIDKAKPIHCNIDGKIDNKSIDILLSDVSADVAKLVSHIENDYVNVYRGMLTGSVRIGGLLSDPEFTGEFTIDNPDFSIPLAIPSHITKDSFLVTLEHNEIRVPEVVLNVRNDPVAVSLTIFFDRWAFDRLEVLVHTPKDVTAHADVDVGVAEFAGKAGVDLKIVYSIEKILDVLGSIYVESINGAFRMNELAAIGEQPLQFFSRVDLEITAGPHVNITFEPLLRCVLVPGTAIKLLIDQTANTFAVTGDVDLRSGDVAYVNRSFYLKEGRLHFNDTDELFDPRITVRAETRERDENGEEVRLILSADNQPYSNFVPQLSSIPAKSELELQTLLGQITVSDSSNIGEIIGAAGEYAIQSMMWRNVENKLRDWLNFDIFSVRTMILQNTLKYSFAGDRTSSKLRVGNFVDNSTVYIGKYFGSAVYVDALMHVSYDETRIDDKATVQGITFQPEFGFELETPFANIRWSTAPDITAMMNNVILPSTSLTLSWRFSF
ncbi:MAG: translocation/assembly module TamB domain-containing protein [Treponema sp.]|nr:translocation/assembly module TamB domain-containing protein [Treponema sp.]